MRCLPRRKKQLWIFFLLFVCLIGVYLSYNRLLDSKRLGGRPSLPYNPQLEKSHKRLREKTQAEIRKAKAESRLGNKDFLMHPQINDEVLHVGGNGAVVGLRALENDDDYITTDEMMARLKLLLIDLTPTNWKTALDVEDMVLQLKSELYDLGIDSELSCKEITALKPGGFHFHSHYGKKSVERLQVDYFHSVVVKSPGKDTQLKVLCMKMDYNEKRCSVMSNYNLMRELVYLLVLKSPSIIKLKGFCLRGETIDYRLYKKGLMIVTEAGEELKMGTLMHFPRPTKLEIAEQLLKLLIYFDTSPIGSLGFDKLQPQDFVMFGTDLKLVDLDNIHIGEIPCVQDTDCVVPEMSRKVIQCENNICKGRNSLNNLLWVNRIFLRNLLQPAPKKYEMEVSRTLDNVQNLEISVQELLDKIIKWRGDDSVVYVGNQEMRDQDIPNNQISDHNKNLDSNMKRDEAINNINKMWNKDNMHFGDKRGNSKWQRNLSTPKPSIDRDNFEENKDLPVRKELDEYIRQNDANYPGLYDYFCTRSRVSWGCVLTIHSIDEAKTFCSSDERCQSFVIYSSNPDISAVMTAVFKNAAKGRPDNNKGATLFFKKKSMLENIGADETLPSKGEKPSVPADILACTRKVLNQTQSGRTTREKRLMTHLGLKGIAEDEWKLFAKSVKVTRSQGLSQMSHKLMIGARLKVVYETNALGLKKGEFLLEKGPTHHHISFMIAYFLDRTLGLYHVPPASCKVFSWNDIQDITGDKKFQELYMKFNESEAIRGVITMPVPPVMKTEKIGISYQDRVVNSIQPYTRTEKSQLEYLLIWSMMKFIQPSHGYLGYKGHLIHFEADVGFGNMKKQILGYFYNCQFPNSVFKTLLCYKCPSTHSFLKICGLGQEVMNQVKSNGFMARDIQIGKYKEKNIVEIIDNNAAAILSVVEHCIKKFSREKVLY